MTAINELLEHMLSEDGERLETRVCVKLMGDHHVNIELSKLAQLSRMLHEDPPKIRIYMLLDAVIKHFQAAEIRGYVEGEVFQRISITVSNKDLELICERCHVNEPLTVVRSVLKRSNISFYDHINLLYILGGLMPDMKLVQVYLNKSYRFESTFTETNIKPLGTAGYHQ